MKQIFYFLLCVPILLFGQNLNKPQLQQDTHQQLVVSAYELFKYEIPEIDNTEMSGHVGTFESGGPWTIPKIVVGAYREDEEDIVYGYGSPFNGWTPTSTHFWDVDAGDDSKIYIIPNYIENAYQKARVFIYGLDIWGNNKILIYDGQLRDWPQLGIFRTTGWFMSYDDIFDLYKTGKYYWEGYLDEGADPHYIHYAGCLKSVIPNLFRNL